MLSHRSLQNLMIQLRKACNHPYLFVDNYHHRPECYTHEIIGASGKFELLDRMLHKLVYSRHRVLVFS